MLLPKKDTPESPGGPPEPEHRLLLDSFYGKDRQWRASA